MSMAIDITLKRLTSEQESKITNVNKVVFTIVLILLAIVNIY